MKKSHGSRSIAVVLHLLTCLLFMSTVTSSRAAEAESSATFKPFKSGLVRCGDAPKRISVDLEGADELYLVVTYGGDSYTCDQAVWADPTLTTADGEQVSLTELPLARSQVGWGQLGVDQDHRGQKLAIAEETFEKGFWAHGPSLLHFKLNGEYDRFTATIGIDRRGRSGTVEFQVLAKSVAMPSRAEFMGKASSKSPSLPLPVAPEKAPHQFNVDAAQRLLDSGVDQLVFIRRYTLNGNHVYTEYVNSRWTPGGGLCVLDLRTGEVRDLLPELNHGVVNRFDVSYDGSTILFDFKASPLEGYRIFEVNADGTELRQLTFPPSDESDLVGRYQISAGYHHGTDDMHPCYLPDGGIVFTTTRCQYGVLCNRGDDFTVKNLYRMDGDGRDMQPLTTSPLSEASPAMLPDGRIVYHRWEYVDKTAGNAKCLWAMNPDGTGSAEVYGNTICFPETMIYPRPIPGAASKIVFLGTSHCCPNNALGAVIVIDTNDDIRSPESMDYITDDIRAYHHNGFHFQNEQGAWVHDKTGKPGRLFKDPYPISESLFIAARKPKGLAWKDPKGYDLVLLDGEGSESLLYKDETISCWHPYPLRSRPVPPVRTGTNDPQLAAEGKAVCIVTDVYVGMNAPEVTNVTAAKLSSNSAPPPLPVERGTIKYLRVLEEIGRPWAARKNWHKDDGDGMAHSALGEGHLGLKVQHGIVPVAADGSAKFTVPADRAIYFQALDKNLMAVQTERTYVNYKPGETRSCIGCHESPANAPPGRPSQIPLAMTRPPAVPAAQPHETTGQKLFDYDRQLQPIWDRHCVACHNSEQSEGGLNLTGHPEGPYCVSYNQLIGLGKSSKQLLGNRRLRDEDTGSQPIVYIPPYMLGAHSSPLASWLSGGRSVPYDNDAKVYAEHLRAAHPDVALTDSELLTITNWLDVNCPYHPSYWGRLNAKYAGHPNYRPDVTFEEARMRSVPETVRKNESVSGTAGRTP